QPGRERGDHRDARQEPQAEQQLQPRRQPVALGEDERRGADRDRAAGEGEELPLATDLRGAGRGVDDEPEERAAERERDAGVPDRAPCSSRTWIWLPFGSGGSLNATRISVGGLTSRASAAGFDFT